MTRVDRRILVAACLAALAGCYDGEAPSPEESASRDEGRRLLSVHGCVTCHVIPGVPGPYRYVGPPLDRFGRRSHVAGRLPNTPEDLTRWIANPKDVDPDTAMPDLRVHPNDARHMADYLQALE